MTTSELIALLKSVEFEESTGKPRIITIGLNGIYRGGAEFAVACLDDDICTGACLAIKTQYQDRYIASVRKPVLCKDCVYNVNNKEHDPLDSTDYSTECVDIVCSYFMTDGMDPSDYCSRGERPYITTERAHKDDSAKPEDNGNGHG